MLREFYVNATRKIPSPLRRATARHIIQQYGVWQVVEIDVEAIARASEIEERHRLSVWDALIVASAQRAGAPALLSEDPNAGQVVEGVRVENPLPH